VSGPSGRLTAEAVAHIAPAVQRVADALGASLSQAAVTV
jgi:IclR family transcriptional regulator, acetate operon repressor